MTMNEAIEQAQEQGGAYIFILRGVWHVERFLTSWRGLDGLIWVSWNGEVSRVR